MGCGGCLAAAGYGSCTATLWHCGAVALWSCAVYREKTRKARDAAKKAQSRPPLQGIPFSSRLRFYWLARQPARCLFRPTRLWSHLSNRPLRPLRPPRPQPVRPGGTHQKRGSCLTLCLAPSRRPSTRSRLPAHVPPARRCRAPPKVREGAVVREGQRLAVQRLAGVARGRGRDSRRCLARLRRSCRAARAHRPLAACSPPLAAAPPLTSCRHNTAPSC